MDNLIISLFVCIAIPMILAIILLEKKSRQTMIFILLGMFMCVYISQINGLFLEKFRDIVYVTTTITPITEEIAKAIPILLFAFVFSDDRQRLITLSVVTGLGFAIMENVYMAANVGNVSLGWSLIRAFGAGLMHSMCTALVGYGISYVHKKRKLFYCGTFALLITASTYHAIYNMLVLSQFKILGYLFPMATYIPFCIKVTIHSNHTYIHKNDC